MKTAGFGGLALGTRLGTCRTSKSTCYSILLKYKLYLTLALSRYGSPIIIIEVFKRNSMSFFFYELFCIDKRKMESVLALRMLSIKTVIYSIVYRMSVHHFSTNCSLHYLNNIFTKQAVRPEVKRTYFVTLNWLLGLACP